MWVLRMTYVSLLIGVNVIHGDQGKLDHHDQDKHQFNWNVP